jgi:hypothetical protein
MQQGTCHRLRFVLLLSHDVPTLDALTDHAGIQ